MKKIITALFCLVLIGTIQVSAATATQSYSVTLAPGRVGHTTRYKKTTSYRNVGVSSLNTTQRASVTRDGGQIVSGPYNLSYGEHYILKGLNINYGDYVGLYIENVTNTSKTFTGRLSVDHSGDWIRFYRFTL